MDQVQKVVGYVQQAASYSGLSAIMSRPSGSTSGAPAIEEVVNVREETPSISSDTYLTLPEKILSMTRIPDLEDAVERCKALVVEQPDDSDEKKLLVRRLIELRLRLHDVKEHVKSGAVDQPVLQDRAVVLGHHFQKQILPKSISTSYCDRCSGLIWNAIHAWHLCTDCDYKCHAWCLNQVCRVCAHVVVSETPAIEEEICPEAKDGLAAQNYRCAECLTRTSHRESVLEPRRCDYNGKYYCPTCHWNSLAVIPARVINNWDFTPRRVCRASKQRLRLLAKLPILHLECLNPVLLASVEELVAVKRIRQRMLLMKKYLTSCKVAMEGNLTWQLTDRLHFLENDERYSLQDLIDLRAGTLLPHLHKLTETFEKHITEDCMVCHGQGFMCEMCQSKSVIFPFEPDIKSCSVCGTAYHLVCWLQNQEHCRKCFRRQKRLANAQQPDL